MRLWFAILLTIASLQAATRVRVSTAAPSTTEFRAAGIYPLDGRTHVRVRASSDGVRWTPWIETERENDGGAFAWFDTPQRWIEVETPADVLFIDPGGKPRRSSLAEPAYVTREQWGCTAAACAFRGGSPAYANVTHLVVHHTAGANTATDWAAVVRSIWTLHVEGNGWSDIGYNYLIDPNGVLYEGRQGGPGVIGAHFSAVNTGTMGVSLLGTFSNVSAAEPAVATLTRMLAWHAQRWQLDPGTTSMHAASQLRLNVISGHRDAGLSPRASGGTECPGNALYVILPRIRQEARRLLDQSFRDDPPSCPSTVPCVWAVFTAGARERTPAVAGSWISIYGDKLSDTTVVDVNLPASLSGVTVTINGTRPAPLLYVSPTQINAQLPVGIPIGSARILVTRDGVPGPEALFWVTEAAPVILGTGVPARAGQPLEVYFTAASNARQPWSASVGGLSAEPLFFGPVPGFVGLFQANILVPPLATGSHDLYVAVAGARSEPWPLLLQ